MTVITALLTSLTVGENVALPLLLLGRPRAEALGRAADWLSRLDDQFPGVLVVVGDQ